MQENKNNKTTDFLTTDLLKHNSENYHPKSASFFGLIIFISLLVGLLGGGIGSYLVIENPSFGRVLNLGNGTSKPVLNQTIVLSEESSVIDVAKKASPAVVSIVISKDISKIRQFGFNPFENDPFFEFFGVERQPKNNLPDIQKVGAGSGFFVSEDGLILTNKHVVSDEQAAYTVITNDGKEYEAKVVATDPRNDLAIIKVGIKGAPFLQFAEPTDITVGQRVIAIGNSLGQYQNSVTTGVVSGIGRSITAGSSEGAEQLDGVIQTDAAINPGNSGGPLLNTASQVVGINTAVDNQGQLLGFAIPAGDAKKALDSFIKNGKITRPFIGVRYIMLTKVLAEKENLPKDYGALLIRGDTVTDFAVVPGSPADKAGLKENDIILEVDGVVIKNERTLAGELKKYDVNSTLTLKVYSGGSEKIVRVTLVESK